MSVDKVVHYKTAFQMHSCLVVDSRIMVTPQSILSVGLKYQNKHCFTTVCNQGDALSSQVCREQEMTMGGEAVQMS